MRVDLETHGREPFRPDLDPAATVGWFTALFPFVARLDSGDVFEHAEFVARQLRAVPRRGIGYGVLRYLSPRGRERLSLLPPSEVLVNYLGRFDGTLDGGWRRAAEQGGLERSTRNALPYAIEIVATVTHDVLATRWRYDSRTFEAATIESLAAACAADLTAIAGRRVAIQSSEATPRQTPTVDVTQTT